MMRHGPGYCLPFLTLTVSRSPQSPKELPDTHRHPPRVSSRVELTRVNSTVFMTPAAISLTDSCTTTWLEKTTIKFEFCMTQIKKSDLSWANWNPYTHPLEISVVLCLASAGCCCTARLPGGPHEGGTRHVEQMTFRIEIQHHRTLRVRSTYSDIRLTYHKAVQNS